MVTSFTMIQGDTKIFTIDCTNELGLPIDLSTASDIRFGAKNISGVDDGVVILKSLGDGIIIQNTNEAVITLSKSDTENLVGKFRYTFTISDYASPPKDFSINNNFIIEESTLY